MPIRKRFTIPERKPRQKREMVSRPDVSKWTNAELALWLEGRAYEIASKFRKPEDMPWSVRTEYDVFVLAADRLK